MQPTRTLGLLGTGAMACGIARLAIESGQKVRVWAKTTASAERLSDCLKQKCKAQLEQGGRIAWGGSPDVLAEADIVVESIAEDLGAKRARVAALVDVVRTTAIVATNTSSLRVSEIMSGFRNPKRCLGMHLMNPPHRIPLVEIVPLAQTSEENVELALQFCRELGREPVVVPDVRGFVLNRVLFPMICEAIAIYGQGDVPAADIDRILKLGARHPMGPLELADFIGLDVCLAILENLKEDLPRSVIKSLAVLSGQVEKGWLGRKTGQGFYTYGI